MSIRKTTAFVAAVLAGCLATAGAQARGTTFGGFAGGSHSGGFAGGSHSGGFAGGHSGGFGGFRGGGFGGSRFAGAGGFHGDHRRSFAAGSLYVAPSYGGYFPGYGDDYWSPYAGYSGYDNGSGCYHLQHVHTSRGWRWANVNVCN